MNKILFTYILFILYIVASSAQQTENIIVLKNSKKEFPKYFPKPIGYVNDFEGILNQIQVAKLDSIITQYELKTTREIVIITTKSIAPYNFIENYSKDISNFWGVGKAIKNNGLTILLSSQLRKIYISTGTGTEKIISNNDCKKIIESKIIPELRESKYYDAILNGLNAFIDLWDMRTE